MPVRVGINGFGRIGRNVFRAALESQADVEVVAVNDITDAKTLAHLLKYDTVYGPLPGDVSVSGGDIKIGATELKVLGERDPAALPWRTSGSRWSSSPPVCSPSGPTPPSTSTPARGR